MLSPDRSRDLRGHGVTGLVPGSLLVDVPLPLEGTTADGLRHTPGGTLSHDIMDLPMEAAVAALDSLTEVASAALPAATREESFTVVQGIERHSSSRGR